MITIEDRWGFALVTPHYPLLRVSGESTQLFGGASTVTFHDGIEQSKSQLRAPFLLTSVYLVLCQGSCLNGLLDRSYMTTEPNSSHLHQKRSTACFLSCSKCSLPSSAQKKCLCTSGSRISCISQSVPVRTIAAVHTVNTIDTVPTPVTAPTANTIATVIAINTVGAISITISSRVNAIAVALARGASGTCRTHRSAERP